MLTSPFPAYRSQGIITFGNIELNEKTRTVWACSVTARRTLALSGHLRNLTVDLEIASPKITSNQVPHSKPDEATLLTASGTCARMHVTMHSRTRSLT